MGCLGARIKQIRERNSLSQESLGQFLGVDRSTVASWETDRREPDLDTLNKIADIEKVSLDWLVGRQDTPSIQQAQSYCDPQWLKFIDIAVRHKIEPEKLNNLIRAALALK